MVYCTFSQYILPQPIQNPVWTYVRIFDGFPDPLEHNIFQIRYAGDTTINSITYNILEEVYLNSQNLISTKIHSLIRQDFVSKSIWTIRKFIEDAGIIDQTEKLLVHTLGNVGDEFVLNGLSILGNDSIFTLDSITNFMGNDGLSKLQYHFRVKNNNYPDDYYNQSKYIEGIGFLTHNFGPNLLEHKSNIKLMCLKLNEDVIYYELPGSMASGIDCDSIGNYLNDNVNFTKETKALFSIFPNPTSGWIQIEMNNNTISSTCRIQISDSTGRFIYSSYENIEKILNIDISKYNEGLYFLSISCSNSVYNHKVILKK